MKTDKIGQELNVGDHICFVYDFPPRLETGIIVNINDTTVTIKPDFKSKSNYTLGIKTIIKYKDANTNNGKRSS